MIDIGMKSKIMKFKIQIEKLYPMSEVKEKIDIKSIVNTNGLVILDFYADWCGPCRAIAPALEDISRSNTEVSVVKIDVDSNQDLAIEFKVTAIPRLVFIKNGEIVDTLSGAQPKSKIQAIIDKYK